MTTKTKVTKKTSTEATCSPSEALTVKSETLEFLQNDFISNPKVAEELKGALALYKTANINTQQQIAVDHIVSTKRLAHYANTAINALDEAEGEITELANVNSLLKAENTEYKNRFGEIDEATRNKMKQSTQLVPLNTDRQRSIARLQKHSKMLLEKEKQI